MRKINAVLLATGFSVGIFALVQVAMTFDVDAKSIVNYRSASEIQVIFGGDGQSGSRGGDGQNGRSGGGATNGGGGIAGSGSGSGSGSSASGESSGSESGTGVGGAGNAGNAGNAGGVGNSASGGMIAHFFRNLLGW
jgi:hypothetical protein